MIASWITQFSNEPLRPLLGSGYRNRSNHTLGGIIGQAQAIESVSLGTDTQLSCDPNGRPGME